MVGNDNGNLSTRGRRDGRDEPAVSSAVFSAGRGVFPVGICYKGEGGIWGRLGALDDWAFSGSSPLLFDPVDGTFDRIVGSAYFAGISEGTKG